MTERPEIKDADEFITKLDETDREIKESFTNRFGSDFFESLGDVTFNEMCWFIEMQILFNYEDRKLSIETFHRMDVSRRDGIANSILKRIDSLNEELGRREQGIFPEPDGYWGDSSTDELKELLEAMKIFREELGITPAAP